MTTVWPFVIAVVPVIARLGRDVITLWCGVLRRADIERIIQAGGERTRVVDRSADGTVLEIVVERAGPSRTRSRAE
ncbi:hypothetical protein ALI144C_10440 [Actinosynnema sp. ALI-1.44]|uniref:hypothetical protein n=1 Tax=Actinosynnema sp. ALI-1.44 TaxID=1933779 RepID=UPI00097C34FD|nr:hypothetical protein [Actinosynnema sp. ALI-1.44]ONI87042.1 hypothetical protein ALI144C_10440 [Actinosynnema sp. ALI-1.44]